LTRQRKRVAEQRDRLPGCSGDSVRKEVPPPDSPVTVACLRLCHTLVLPHTTTEASGAAAGSVTRVPGGLCATGRCVCGCLRV
ncbi:unnamed protein product, partial [Ectocarpus sp. 12 AP-2014]